MVINNKIVFIPIPKNASWSVEDTCISYGFDLQYPNKLWENSINLNVKPNNRHLHSTIDFLIDSFGTDLEYVCIIRDSVDRFISAWKFFIVSLIHELNITDTLLSIQLKNKDNDFVINFIKKNYFDFTNAYNSILVRKKLLIKLLEELEISNHHLINEKFKNRYALHIFSLISQYQWILNDKVKVKQFQFDKLYEFENYISEKLDVDFKLLHKNNNNLDYCAVTKTPELIEFVTRYIDGMYKKTKSLL